MCPNQNFLLPNGNEFDVTKPEFSFNTLAFIQLMDLTKQELWLP